MKKHDTSHGICLCPKVAGGIIRCTFESGVPYCYECKLTIVPIMGSASLCGSEAKAENAGSCKAQRPLSGLNPDASHPTVSLIVQLKQYTFISQQTGEECITLKRVIDIIRAHSTHAPDVAERAKLAIGKIFIPSGVWNIEEGRKLEQAARAAIAAMQQTVEVGINYAPCLNVSPWLSAPKPLERVQKTGENDHVDINRCPKCGGDADNGHDRSYPPNPYYCTKCMGDAAKAASEHGSRVAISTRPPPTLVIAMYADYPRVAGCIFAPPISLVRFRMSKI